MKKTKRVSVKSPASGKVHEIKIIHDDEGVIKEVKEVDNTDLFYEAVEESVSGKKETDESPLKDIIQDVLDSTYDDFTKNLKTIALNAIGLSHRWSDEWEIKSNCGTQSTVKAVIEESAEDLLKLLKIDNIKKYISDKDIQGIRNTVAKEVKHHLKYILRDKVNDMVKIFVEKIVDDELKKHKTHVQAEIVKSVKKAISV